MSPAAVSHISSVFSSGQSHLAISSGQNHLASRHISIPSPQRVFRLSADTISKLNIPDIDSIDFKSLLPADFSNPGIIKDLKEYFKGITEDLKKNADVIIAGINQINWSDSESVREGFKPLGEYLMPVFEYAKDHLWILLPLVIPMFDLFLMFVGFQLAGVASGSLAAIIQSKLIGDVEKGTVFAFFQSVGARGWAYDSLSRANYMITIAVIIVAVGQQLVERGIIDPDKIQQALEGTWNRAVQKFDPPPMESAASITVLNLNHGWVKYGVWASVLIPVMMCAGEGL